MSILIRLTGYGWRHRWYLLGAFVTMLLSTASIMVIPSLLGTAIDEAVSSGLRIQLLRLSGLILLVSGLRALFSYGQSYLAEAVSQKAAYDLRNDFFRKLQSLSFGFHDRQQTGNLMSRATSDVEAVRMFISMGLIRGVSVVVLLGGVSGIMLATNWRLGLVCMAFVPLVMWRAIWTARKLRNTWKLVQEETGHMTTVLQENLTGMRVVKAFGAQRHEETKFEEKAGAVASLTYATSRMFASQGSLMTLIFTLATGAILWFGGREALSGRLTLGELSAFIFYMGLLTMPVRMIGWLMNTLSRAAAAGQRLFEVLDAESPVKERQGAVSLPRATGQVRFENVSLSYDSAGPALQGIDLDVEPGSLVAVLGAAGSGKSTLAHLIPRFYDVTDGRIAIDGVDIRDVTLASLRQNVGIVLQDVFVFGATIRDNVSYGRDDASMEDIQRAAVVAQLDDFVETLPKGYDTWVGERGITLSGGQRQRLAIARTLLLDPPVLILDDSTSSVDVETEYKIQQALAEVVKGRTTFVIAHRLSTVRQADLILVLEEGRIVERGTHEELLVRDGFYRRIYDLQLRPQQGEALAEARQGGGGAP